MTVNHGKTRKVYNRLIHSLSALYPQRCRGCGGAAGAEAFCRACSEELPWLGPACPGCARPQPTPTPCGRCLQQPRPYASCSAAFAYLPPIDRLVKRFKFSGDLAAGRELGLLLGRQLAAGAELPDCLVAMPLHPARLRSRGYNQSLELARQLGKQLGLQVDGRRLRRVRPTAVQSELPAAQRSANVRGAFVSNRISGHVALVDDVLTTGHTAAAATKALLRAGAERVDVWVLARAGN